MTSVPGNRIAPGAGSVEHPVGAQERPEAATAFDRHLESGRAQFGDGLVHQHVAHPRDLDRGGPLGHHDLDDVTAEQFRLGGGLL